MPITKDAQRAGCALVMISVIIIVKGDRRISNTLHSLADSALDHSAFETVVVDASPGPQDVKQSFPDVTWIRFCGHGQKVTIPEQRNVGVRASSGSVLAFIDADCKAEVDWLEQLTRPILLGEEYITAGSCVAVPSSYMVLREMTSSQYMDECATMNMAVSRKVFDSVGLFDEDFERVSDSEFCFRARKAGYRIRAVPQAVIYHDWGGARANIRRSYGSGAGRARLYRKHPDAILSRSFYHNRKNVYSIVYGAYALFLPISVIFPLYLLLPFCASVLFRRNPWKEVVNVVYGIGLVRGILHRGKPTG